MLSPVAAIALGALVAASVSAQETGSTRRPLSALFDLDAPLPGTEAYRVHQRSERISEALSRLDAISAAYVSIHDGGGGDGGTAVTIHVRPAEHTPWSPQVSVAVLEIVRRLEPGISESDVLVIDSAARVLMPQDRAGITPAPPAESGVPSGHSAAGSMPLVAGAVGGLLVIGFIAWRLWAPGFGRGAPPPAAEPDPWAFLADAGSDSLRRVFSERRPEVLGAVLAAADARTAKRVRRKLARQIVGAVPPVRPMHAAVAASVRGELIAALGAAERRD